MRVVGRRVPRRDAIGLGVAVVAVVGVVGLGFGYRIVRADGPLQGCDGRRVDDLTGWMTQVEARAHLEVISRSQCDTWGERPSATVSTADRIDCTAARAALVEVATPTSHDEALRRVMQSPAQEPQIHKGTWTITSTCDLGTFEIYAFRPTP